jgi:hypothetical protein
MVFYLFRVRSGVNGIPLPSSAQYRLWIQPKPRRRQAGNADLPKTHSQQVASTPVPAGHPSR